MTGSRCVVTGAVGRPLARGRLLFGAQRVTLSRWPQPDEILLRFEQTDPQLEYLLRTECLLRPGHTRLFRIASDGLAYECRSLRVRPGARYIIVNTTGPISSKGHTSQIDISCEGVYGAILNLPHALSEDWEDVLHHLGIGQAKTIEVWPAGLSAVTWDGEGHGEWLASERPCLGIQSDHTLDSLILSMGTHSDQKIKLTPVMPGKPVFVELSQLPVGLHTLHISAQSTLPAQRELLGDLDVVMRIREAQPWSSGVSHRGPLIAQVEPASPTLEQLWEGRVGVTIRGPANRKVNCRVSLFEREDDPPIYSNVFPPLQLPVTADHWRVHLERYFCKKAENYYDIARLCELEFEAEELGAFTVRCEREFTPFRWSVLRQGSNYIVRLIDDSGDSSQPEILYIAFETPFDQHLCKQKAEYNAPETGGMYVARVNEFQSAVIVPPMVRSLEDLGCTPRINNQDRSIESIFQSLSMAKLWNQAKLSGNFSSLLRRRIVMRAIISHIFQLIGGKNWANAERLANSGTNGIIYLKRAVSTQRGEIAVGTIIADEYVRLAASPLEERVNRIKTLAMRFNLLPSSKRQVRVSGGKVIRRTNTASEPALRWLSEFALRLASDPCNVDTWAGNRLNEGLERLIKAPTMARAARFLVLATDHHLKTQSAIGDIFAGWEWP